MSAERQHPVIDKLQTSYNENRPSRTWGTPPVSGQFFNTWREQGLPRAVGYLVTREKELGDPKLPAALKAFYNMAGSALFLTGVEQFVKANKQEPDTTATEVFPNSNSPTKKVSEKAKLIAASALVGLGYVFVVAAQGEADEPPGGYVVKADTTEKEGTPVSSSGFDNYVRTKKGGYQNPVELAKTEHGREKLREIAERYVQEGGDR